MSAIYQYHCKIIAADLAHIQHSFYIFLVTLHWIYFSFYMCAVSLHQTQSDFQTFCCYPMLDQPSFYIYHCSLILDPLSCYTFHHNLTMDLVWLFKLSISILTWNQLRFILTSTKQNGTLTFKKLYLVRPHGFKNLNH